MPTAVATQEKQEKLDDVLSAVHYARGGQFRPTLVIGLGGSGVETARRVKRLLRERYRITSLIGFLFLDTDEGQYLQRPEQADVDQYERASIVVRRPEELLSEWKRKPELHPQFEQFLADEMNVSLLHDASGAAGIRPAGRFAFHASFDVLYPQFLEPAVNRIMLVRERAIALMEGAQHQIEITQSQPRVYILSSLCGGTGSGIFLDTAVVIRHIFDQYGLDGEIVGIFYLPSVFRHETGITASMMEVIEANAYASLMELEYFCDPETFRDGDNELLHFKYPMLNSVRLREPLCDEVFLVEGISGRGESLSQKHCVFEMVARSVMLDIGSPLGAYARSIRRNSMAVIELLPCAETGKHRLMGSLGVTNLTVPIEELVRYCALRAAMDIWGDGTSAGEPADVESSVESLLQRLKLKADDVDWLLDEQFLQDKDGVPVRFTIPSAQELITRAQNAGHNRPEGQARFIAEELSRDRDRFLESWLPEQDKRMEQRTADLRKQFCKEIGDAGAEILKNSSYDSAQQFFEQIRDRLTALHKQLTTTIDALRKEQSAAEYEFIGAVEALPNAVKQQRSSLFGRVDIQPSVENARQKLLEYANASLRLRAAERAQSSIKHNADQPEEKAILDKIDGWRDTVGNWKTHEERTINRLRDLKNGTKERKYGYDLEWLVILEKDFESFYQKLDIPKEEIRKRLSELKSSYKQVPAFGGLSSHEISAEEEAELRMRAAAEVLLKFMPEKANVLTLIHETLRDGQNGTAPRSEFLRRKLQLLFDACQPFWSTSHPPGERRYETFMVCSVPSSDTKEAEILRQAVGELAEERGARPEYREDGYPYALTVMTRTYGARAYYLRSTARMRTFYYRRAEDEKVRARLHLDKRFYELLPRLEPLGYDQEEVDELIAWALVFGYIAQQDGNFFWSVKQSGQHTTPRFVTQWQPLLQDLLPEAWTKRLLQRPSKDEFLGSDRQALFKEMTRDKSRLDVLRATREQVEKVVDLRTLTERLEECVDQLHELANNAPTRREAEPLERDMRALERYHNHLQQRLEW